MKEKEIQKTILEYLTIKGYFVWRNNTGAIISNYKGKERFFRYGASGSGDILGLLKNGRFLSIEVKMPKKAPSEAQVAFMSAVNASGGLAFVATSLDDVIANGL